VKKKSKSKAPARKPKHRDKRERRTQSGFYPGADGKSLFVPTLAMLAYREEAAPLAICRAAGIDAQTWYDWRKYHAEAWSWMWGEPSGAPGWLYHWRDPPDGLTIVSPTNQGPRCERRPGEYWPDPRMFKFRKHSHIQATYRRARECDAGAVRKWLKTFADIPWFQRWLLCHDDAPRDVVVATARQIRRAAAAWHWQPIVKEKGPYLHWYHDVFPRGELLAFARWLYGERPPAGWVFVSEKAQKLRERLSRAGTLAAAGVWKGSLQAWMRDPLKAEALADLMSNPSMAGKEPKDSAAWKKLFDGVSGRAVTARNMTRDAMLRYGEVATLTAAMRDVAFLKTNWIAQRNRAAKIAGNECRKDLEAHVAGTLATTAGKNHAKAGVIAAHLFLPTAEMRALRDRLKALSVANAAAGLWRELPCVDQWFLDWTKPRDLGPRAGEGTTGRAELDGTGNRQADPPVIENGEPATASEEASLAASLGKCETDRQKAIVKAVAQRTAGRPTYEPQGKEIAKAAGDDHKNANFRRALKKCFDLGALKGKRPGTGYRLG